MCLMFSGSPCYISLLQFGWFSGVIKKKPDIGTFNPKTGLTGIFFFFFFFPETLIVFCNLYSVECVGVGSSYYMTNFNITLDTQDTDIGEYILKVYCVTAVSTSYTVLY